MTRKERLDARGVLFSCFLFALAILPVGCGGSGGGGDKGEEARAPALKGDVGADVCADFPVDFVYSAIGKPIVKVEGPGLPSIHACRWYTEYSDTWFRNTSPGGRFVSIVAESLDIENQKKYTVSNGGLVETDPRIKMDHVILRNKDKAIISVDLLIRPMRYIRVDKMGGPISDDEQIEFAARVAGKIHGRSDMKLRKNPIDLTSKPAELGESREDLARKFFETIGKKEFEQAAAMMDADARTRSMWVTNFKTLKSVRIKKVEEVFKDEWTDSRQSFKFTLEVSTDEQGERLGWSNGENVRFVTLRKNHGVWQVHELADNP